MTQRSCIHNGEMSNLGKYDSCFLFGLATLHAGNNDILRLGYFM